MANICDLPDSKLKDRIIARQIEQENFLQCRKWGHSVKVAKLHARIARQAWGPDRRKGDRRK